MAELNIGSATTPTKVLDFSVSDATTDGINVAGETFYNNENFTKFYGRYKSTTKVKAAIKAFATWIVGLGWTSPQREILENIGGSGKDTLLTVLWNMLIIEKVNGDSYAQIVRDSGTGTIINLKPLDPASMSVVFNTEGLIDRYEQRSKVKRKKNEVFQPEEIFHLVNDRVADETHGDSVIESLEWNIDAQEEARRMFRKKVKNNGVVGIIEIDDDDPARITALKAPLKTGIEDGDFLMIPKGVVEVKDWGATLDTQGIIAWLNYLDDEFYQMIGLPKIIGGASGEIEGDSKVSYLAFEPNYKREIRELEDDFFNQLGITIKFNLPPSLNKEILGNEQANSSQTGFQSNDTTAGVGV